LYDNKARASAADENRTAIILALVDLLVENNGANVEVAQIAKRSKISQRTIFRFFKDKPAMHQAVNDYIASYLKDADEHLKTKSVTEFAKFMFSNFETAPKLTTAYVVSSFGQEARALIRKRLNQALLTRLLSDTKLKPTREKKAKLDFLVSLINARVWFEMRTDFGHSGAVTGEVVSWAMEVLIRDLGKP
jgi:AcrR family transcriptional regulator